jgi:hypothetical protein
MILSDKIDVQKYNFSGIVVNLFKSYTFQRTKSLTSGSKFKERKIKITPYSNYKSWGLELGICSLVLQTQPQSWINKRVILHKIFCRLKGMHYFCTLYLNGGCSSAG